MILPNGKTLFPILIRRKGLGLLEHDNMDQAPMIDVVRVIAGNRYSMDGTSKYEILYATFHLEDTDFDAIRYWGYNMKQMANM